MDEPIFNLRIDFTDGSNSVRYHNLDLGRTMVALQVWAEDYILIPLENCSLAGPLWVFTATRRGSATEDEDEKEEELDDECD